MSLGTPYVSRNPQRNSGQTKKGPHRLRPGHLHIEMHWLRSAQAVARLNLGRGRFEMRELHGEGPPALGRAA